MAFTMACVAESNPVRDFIPQFGASGEWLDVVRVKRDFLAVTVTSAAVLAGVVIPFEYSLAPICIFDFTASNVILGRFVCMAPPFGLLCALRLFSRGWIGEFGASIRAYLSSFAAFFVLRHRLAADRAGDFDCETVGAKLVKGINILATLVAYLTGLSDAARIGFISGGTSDAGSIFGGISRNGYRRGWNAANGARLQVGIVARLAYAIFAAVRLADDTPVLCHVAIISQLPNLRGVRHEM